MNIVTSERAPAAPERPVDSHNLYGLARQLSTQTLYVLLGNVFTLAIGLPLQIYVARVIGSAGLGIYGLIDGAIFTMSGILGFGVAQTAVRFIPAHLEHREYAAVRNLLRLGAVVLLSAGGISYALVLITLPFAGEFWPELAGYRHVIAVMALMLPLGLLLHFLQQSLRGFQEIRYMVLGSSVLQLTVKAAVTVAAFAVGMRLEGYVLASVLGAFVGVLWMARGLQRKLSQLPHEQPATGGSKSDASHLREWRRYASVCYINGLLGVASARLDRFILGAFVDSSAVGVLMIVLQLQQLPQLFLTMLLSIGAPMLAAAHSRGAAAERDHVYALMTDWAVKASLPLILFLMLFTKQVLALFGPEFAESGVEVLRLLLLLQAVLLTAGPVGTVAMMCGLERVIVRFSVVDMVLSTVLTIGLAIKFGLVGVVAARITAAVVVNTLVIVAVRRRLHFHWWNRRFIGWFLPAVVSICLGMVVLYTGVPLGAVSLVATLLAMYGTFALMLLVQGLHDDERDLLRSITARFTSREK